MLALLTRTLRRKVGLGRVSVPIWGVCLLVAVLAASGQVGKALTGENCGYSRASGGAGHHPGYRISPGQKTQ